MNCVTLYLLVTKMEKRGKLADKFNQDKRVIDQISNESKTAAQHERRKTAIKNLRECATRIIKTDYLAEFDTLLTDQVLNDHRK